MGDKIRLDQISIDPNATPEQRILPAAEALFRLQGYNRTTIAQVEEVAKTGSGNMRRYYDDMKAIALAMGKQNTEDLEVYLDKLDRNTLNPRDRLRTAMEHHAGDGHTWYARGDFTLRMLNDCPGDDKELKQTWSQFYKTYFNWLKRTLRAIGVKDPHALAFELYASLFGAVFLSRILESHETMLGMQRDQIDHLDGILDSGLIEYSGNTNP